MELSLLSAVIFATIAEELFPVQELRSSSHCNDYNNRDMEIRLCLNRTMTSHFMSVAFLATDPALS